MQALKQKVRPKHQVLILKCYPRLPKNSSAAEIKPNGSELSYLLYYASSRRSKLSKVGTFLEKRTASDLSKSRTSSVQITLQILTAFLNNPGIGGAGPQGFGLFAPFVLRLIRDVLKQANDAILIETAVPTWESFCRHQDHVALSADLEYRTLFADVVRLWAGYATKDQMTGRRETTKGQMRVGATDALRLRRAGLQALKGIADSDALGTEAGRQLDIVMPVVLQNLYGSEAELQHLLRMQIEDETMEKEKAQKGSRPSLAVGRNTTDEGDVRAAEVTAAEADKLADEEASVLALQCLKSLFAVENRQQTRSATNCVLSYIITKRPAPTNDKTRGSANDRAWSLKMFETVCNWTPVQDRFIALFTALEILVRSPIKEDNLADQVLLAQIVSHILGSNINLIGLSVMDILLGLLQHVLLILQLGTTRNTFPGPGQSGVTSSEEDLKGRSSTQRSSTPVMEVVKTPSPARVQLLDQLRQCIANLAVHIYYTDQISDMVSAILLRLKPSPAATHNPAITAVAIEDPTAAAAEVATQSSLRERPNTDGFFSFDTAREVALSAVKDIILVANSDRSDSSYVADNRNGVPISVWEGTQWLLRDSCADVRYVYVDALCTWLRLELRKTNLRLEEDKVGSEKKRRGNDSQIPSRAASTASTKHKTARRTHSTFLQLLHLAVYENALQHAETSRGETDILCLHLLLTTLSHSLGLNAVSVGLPMMLQLQDDSKTLANTRAKIRIGSLVYGYFWAIADVFDLKESKVSRDIFAEITRRRKNRLWVDSIRMPPVPIEQIAAAAASDKSAAIPVLDQDSFVPFADRNALIDALQPSYFASLLTPSNSPSLGPTRSASLPALTFDTLPEAPTSQNGKSLPQSVVDELRSPWSKDALLAALAVNAPRPSSLAGSSARLGQGGRSPTFAVNSANGASNLNRDSSYNNLLRNEHRHLLAATNSYPFRLSRSRTRSREGSPALDAQRQPSYASSTNSIIDRLGMRSQSRRRTQGSPGLATDDGRRYSETTSQGKRALSVAGTASRVEELKRVLATGGTSVGENRGRSSYDAGEDTGSDSLVDVDESFATYADEEDINNSNPTRLSTTQNVATRDMAADSPASNDDFDTFRTPPLIPNSPATVQPRNNSYQGVYTLTGGPGDDDIIDAAFAHASAPTIEENIDSEGDDSTLIGSTPLLRLNSDTMPGQNGAGMSTIDNSATVASGISTDTGAAGLSTDSAVPANTKGLGIGNTTGHGTKTAGGKKGLSDLLDSIDVDDADGDDGRGDSGLGFGLGRPPY